MKLAVALLLIGIAADAQPPVRNGLLERRALQGSLDSQFHAIATGGAVWVGYAQASVAGQHSNCDATSSGTLLNPVRLEPPNEVNILYRFQDGKLTKLRNLGPDCELDASGARIIWLTGVSPSASLAYLSSLVGGDPEKDETTRRFAASAMFIASLHADASADKLLASWIAPNQPALIRKHALFPLSANRGKAGIDTLIRLAREDHDRKVREAALFWLAHKAGKVALGPIQSAIDNDPEVRVKEQAVFALTKMPQGEGVPLLIDLARSNRSPAVRKKAMFWLGQSNDPRALKYFEDILTR